MRFFNGGGQVRIEVRDNGTELPLPEDRLFEPFERASIPDLPPGQLGLGLTISRRLARMMDGDVTYRRQDGCTVFTLELSAA